MRFICSLVIFFAPNVFAVEIVDADNVLLQLEAKLASGKPLFVLGDKVLIDRRVESCEITCYDPEPGNIGGCGSICKVIPMVTERSVVSQDSHKSVIVGSEGFYEEVTVDEVKQCRGNLAFRFLKQLDNLFNFDGTLTLTNLSTFRFPLGEGTPNARLVEAFSVNGRFTPAGYKSSFAVKVSVIPTAPGIGQVALFSASGEVWFRLKDF